MINFILATLFVNSIILILNDIKLFNSDFRKEDLKEFQKHIQGKTVNTVIGVMILAITFRIIWKPVLHGLILYFTHDNFLLVLSIFFN